MKKISMRLPERFSEKGFMILRAGLPVVSAELIAITAKYSSLTRFEQAVSVGALREMLIHIAMSVTLLVGGALLFDIAERDMKN